MYPITTIPKLHQEYHTWMSELNFYKEEIKRYERRLEDVINKKQPIEVKANVEQFQNQFICEKEVIDELKHKLNVSEKQLAGFVKELSGLGLDSIKMDNHPKLREDMNVFRNLFNDMKDRFKNFSTLTR